MFPGSSSLRRKAILSRPARLPITFPFLAFLSIGILFIAYAVAQETSGGQQDPERLEKTAESYESVLKSESGTLASRIEVREHLGAVYYLLHRYRDSLNVLAPVLQGQHNSDTSTKASDSTLTAQSWTVSGLDYLELNQLNEAIRSFHKSLAIKPASANARLALGDALARSGRVEEAAEQYEQQTKQTPTLADAWYKLGLAHSQISVNVPRNEVVPREKNLTEQLNAEELLAKGDTMNAARRLFRLAHHTPVQPEVHADLGSALLTLGYVNAAQDHFQQELVKNPDSPQATLGLVQTAALAGNWSQVGTNLERLSIQQPHELTRLLEFPPAGLVVQSWSAGQMNPPASFIDSPVGQLWKSWMSDSNVVARLSVDYKADTQSCGQSLKDSLPGVWLAEVCYSELIRQLTRGKSLAAGARAKLTEAEFRLGKYDDALRSANQLRAANPHSGWAIYWQSKAHDAIAEECFLKVGELNPDSARVHQMLAERYLKLSDYPKARTEFESALRLAPASADLRLGLGKVLSRTSDWPSAEKELRTALELAPSSSFARYELGHVYVQQSMWPQAIEQLRKVPDDSTVLLSSRLDLAKAESEMGQTSDAVKDLLSVASLDQDGELYFRLASLYRRLGDSANAQQALATFRQRRSASLQTDTQEVGALENEQSFSRAAEPPSH